jgi:hypothetical protein
MPSKELIALAANAMEERRKELIAQPLSRIYPQLAEAAAGAIHAALREPTEGMLDVKAPWPDHWGDYDKASPMQRSAYQIDRLVARSSWRAMLAASALGEQSE